MNTTAIQNHLQADAIIEVREWAQVLWVKAVKMGKTICRFVSKKVVNTQPLTEKKEEALAEAKLQRCIKIGGRLWERDDKRRVYFPFAWFQEMLGISNRQMSRTYAYSKVYWDFSDRKFHTVGVDSDYSSQIFDHLKSLVD